MLKPRTELESFTAQPYRRLPTMRRLHRMFDAVGMAGCGRSPTVAKRPRLCENAMCAGYTYIVVTMRVAHDAIRRR